MKNLFLIAGFQRSGSTFLSKLLNSHPEILMNSPIFPEPKFFIKPNISSLELKEYFSFYFQKTDSSFVFGEKSVSYIESEEALKQFKKLFPKGKLILIMRNPTDRAISNYELSVTHGLETRSMEEVFVENIKPPKYSISVSVSPFDYLERGKYNKYIKKAYKFFSKEEILFVCLEEIISNKNSIKKIETFLGINSYDFSSFNFDPKINKTVETKKVPQEIIIRLNSYYKSDIEELKKITHLKLKQWKFN